MKLFSDANIFTWPKKMKPMSYQDRTTDNAKDLEV